MEGYAGRILTLRVFAAERLCVNRSVVNNGRFHAKTQIRKRIAKQETALSRRGGTPPLKPILLSC